MDYDLSRDKLSSGAICCTMSHGDLWVKGLFIAKYHGHIPSWEVWASRQLDLLIQLRVSKQYLKMCDHWAGKVYHFTGHQYPVDLGYMAEYDGQVRCHRRVCLTSQIEQAKVYIIRPRRWRPEVFLTIERSWGY